MQQKFVHIIMIIFLRTYDLYACYYYIGLQFVLKLLLSYCCIAHKPSNIVVIIIGGTFFNIYYIAFVSIDHTEYFQA